MRDFNFGNCIVWKNNVSHREGKIFLKYIVKKFLILHVDQSTKDSYTLDLVISSDADLAKDSNRRKFGKF